MNILKFLLLFITSSCILFGETFNTPTSLSVTRFAQFANSCAEENVELKKANLAQLDSAIAQKYSDVYAEVCEPLATKLGIVYELHRSNQGNTPEIVGFGEVTQPAKSRNDVVPPDGPDGRYVIYWDGSKFRGHFLPIEDFDKMLAKQNLNIGSAKVFTFPGLRQAMSEQKTRPSVPLDSSMAPPVPSAEADSQPGRKAEKVSSEQVLEPVQKDPSKSLFYTFGALLAVGVGLFFLISNKNKTK